MNDFSSERRTWGVGSVEWQSHLGCLDAFSDMVKCEKTKENENEKRRSRLGRSVLSTVKGQSHLGIMITGTGSGWWCLAL
jgi:hypothetical protein